MKTVFGLAFLLFCSLSLAQSLGAENKFTSLPIYGDLTIQCRSLHGDAMRTVHYQCEDQHLAPSNYAYFFGPKAVDADRVELQTTFQNGKQSRLKTDPYFNGKSVDQLNLWISTLFQVPLLSKGLNRVSYVLKKSGAIIDHGVFNVDVEDGPAKHCLPGFITNGMPSDCESPYTLCEQYFQQNNYCASLLN